MATRPARPAPSASAEAGKSKPDRQFLLDLYRWSRLTRMVDDRLAIFYKQNEVVGGVYACRGQEGLTVAATMALGPDDFVAPIIRNMGAMLVRGIAPRDIFCQYMARKDGPTGGRDLNTHFGDLSKGVVAPISMLGSLIPVMVGIALAKRAQGKDVVTLSFIGDGGSSTGEFHEGLNYAATSKAPFVLILENNQYAYSTPTRMQSGCTEFVERARGYGIHGETVDGNDMLAMHEVVRRSVERARAGGGPTLIEAHTMRMQGHAAHDDFKYVPRELLDEWAKRDPIDLFVRHVTKQGWLTAADLAAVDAELKAFIDAEADFAQKSPWPPGEWAPDRVYAE
jgi:TPP-dependent pyruvate/acetoin dehydrogenase alpha subunit